jgi:dTDP-4-dehydrorhamnose reductase
MARVLVTGARGMLGRRMVEVFGQRHEVIPTAHSASPEAEALDITDRAAVARIVARTAPDWIVNAAAYTAVDRAESEEALAMLVNADGPRELASAACASGARLLHVSTDFVFRGEGKEPLDEHAPAGPVGAYARSKWAGEEAVRRVLPRALIFRVAWLFGPDGKNFVDTILKAARDGRSLRVVADQWGTPTFTVDAAQAALAVMEAGLEGTVHAANTGVTSWHAFATEACRIAGLRTEVQPITTADWPTPARRPQYSALHNRVLEERLGRHQRSWQDALEDHISRSSAS